MIEEMMKNPNLKNKRVEVKLPEELHEKIKLRFGHNISKTMRDHFTKILQAEELQLEKFRICYFCKNKDDIPFEELYMTTLNDEPSKFNNHKFITKSWVVCSNCLKELLDKTLEKECPKGDVAEGVKFFRCLFEHNAKQLSKTYVEVYARLYHYFPNKWSVDEGCIEGIFQYKEEMKEQMIKINKLKEEKGK